MHSSKTKTHKVCSSIEMTFHLTFSHALYILHEIEHDENTNPATSSVESGGWVVGIVTKKKLTTCWNEKVLLLHKYVYCSFCVFSFLRWNPKMYQCLDYGCQHRLLPHENVAMGLNVNVYYSKSILYRYLCNFSCYLYRRGR